MSWVLGVDGGGTRTIALAGDEAGNIIAGPVFAGPSNYHTAGLGGVRQAIASVLGQLAQQGYTLPELAAAVFGLAGSDRPHDRSLLLKALKDMGGPAGGLQCPLLVVSDAEVALVGGLGRREGVVLVSGTGSIAFGINREGELFRAGGWGRLVSDEGSGYDIGRQALARSIRAREGRDIPSTLLGALAARLGCDDFDSLIGYLNAPGQAPKEVAALAETVAEAAAAGDRLAASILADAGDALASLAISVIKRGFAADGLVPVVGVGGVLAGIPAVWQRTAAALAGWGILVRPLAPPAAGAVKMAAALAQGGAVAE